MRPSRSAATSSRGDEVPSGFAGGVRSAQAPSSVPTTATPERRRDPDRVGERAHRRARERTGDRRAHRSADHLPAPLARRGAGDPGHRPGPRRRSAHALHEARRVEHRDRIGEGEGDAGSHHQAQSQQHGCAHSGPRREVAAGYGADERAGRIGGNEHSGGRFGQAELILEARQQRRDRRVERCVDEHDRAGEDE